MDQKQSVQHFLDLIKRSHRGKFKIYIGMIAGVGKSYRMLQEAHQLHLQMFPFIIHQKSFQFLLQPFFLGRRYRQAFYDTGHGFHYSFHTSDFK